ncbi:YhdP family protein [Ramlibacter algicola]|uniref:TIGR02099 family protein n=1 Tax=Ramlibacter algicola TaxID=2795217 RepID=A0A934UQ75_9BURK|nr:YhdP family protein [Ramlibacter algicola]MBK0391252.1 TIGR02099 family protein [Ramlibacter algicola]
MNDSPPIPSRLLQALAACAKWSLVAVAACWLLLALAWGALHAWIVPRIGEYRPELEARASRALGVPVRIAGVTTVGSGLLPSVELRSVVLLDPQGREALRLDRVLVSLSPRSLWNFGFDQIAIEGPRLDMRRTADGRLLVAGLDLSGSGGDGGGADWFFRQGEVILRGGTVRWTDEQRGTPELGLADVQLVVRNGGRRHAMRLDATPPPAWGDRFTLIGGFRHPLLSVHPGRWQDWDGQLHADFRRVDLRELRRHAQAAVDIGSGHGAVRAWLDVKHGQLVGATADLAVADVSVRIAQDLPPLALTSLSGRIGGQRRSDGFDVETHELQFTTDAGQRWPGGNLALSYTEATRSKPASGELRGDRIDLTAVRQLAGRLPLGAATHEALATFAPQGLVETVQARWQGSLEAPSKYQARGRVSGLSVASVAHRGGAGSPGVRNAALDFDLTEAGGTAKLAMQDGALDLPGVFEDPVLPFERLSADVQWHLPAGKASVTVSNLKFSNLDAAGEGQATWRMGDDPARRFPGVIDLTASLSRANGARVFRYLPLGVPQSARDYVRDSVQRAEVTEARARLKGDLRDFPFTRQRSGEFRVTAQVRDATYAFVPKAAPKTGNLPWPALTQLSAQLVFDRSSLRVEDAQGRFPNAPGLRVKAEAGIADLAHTAVDVNGEIRGPLGEALTIVQRSPVNLLTHEALSKATATGNADVRLKLALPIAQIDRSTVQGTVTLANNDVQLSPDSPQLQRARGAVTFNERGFTLVNTQARALGGEVKLDGGTRPMGVDTAVVVRAQGTATAEGLRQARELSFVPRLARQASGSSTYAATVTFRRSTPEILVTSSLQGLALNLPAPLGKAADTAMPLRYENVLVRDTATTTGQADQLSVDVGRIASVNYVRDLTGPEPRVLRGALAIGLQPGETAPLPDQGVTANIALGTADLDGWSRILDALSPSPAPAAQRSAYAASVSAASTYLPSTLALRARELTFSGRTLHNLVVGATREGLGWRGNVHADELSGYVEYREGAGPVPGRVFARLARLAIASSQANAVESLLSEQPASIPTLDVVVDDFDLRGKKLGRLEIEAVNRGAIAREGNVREWRLNKLTLASPEGTVNASGNWAALEAQAAAPRGAEKRRTVMNFKIDLVDAGGLLARLGMKDVVRGGQGKMEGQVAWIGSPLSLDYPSMTGAFHVNVEKGQFLKADPGLAKLLGVLSLQSLPRRLTLDFRDVFSQGFSFDFVRGDITVQQGIAATNNLQMKGVNAAVLMEGKADLERETQDLRVVVVPEINAGTASLVAAAINPAIGLGTFLAQLLLRDPLARATTQQFQIDGTWTDPKITKLDKAGPARPAASGNNGER